jgi:hypothetical protein
MSLGYATIWRKMTPLSAPMISFSRLMRLRCLPVTYMLLSLLYCHPVPLSAGTCPELSSVDAMQRIATLTDDIRNHNKLYYRELRPVVSDAEYDRLFAELVLLEECFPVLAADDSPTRTVGSAGGEGVLTVWHERPMLSLSSSTGPEAVEILMRKVAAASGGVELPSRQVGCCCDEGRRAFRFGCDGNDPSGSGYSPDIVRQVPAPGGGAR